MPLLDVKILAGRPPAAVRHLIATLTDATVEALGVAPDSVRILVTEIDPAHWAVGGTPKSDSPPSS